MNQRYNRIIPVVATIAIQLCLGTAYIWSVFQAGIAESLFAGNNASAALTFSILLAVLSVGSTIGGKLQDKVGPRLTVIIGGLILALGFSVHPLPQHQRPMFFGLHTVFLVVWEWDLFIPLPLLVYKNGIPTKEVLSPVLL